MNALEYALENVENLKEPAGRNRIINVLSDHMERFIMLRDSLMRREHENEIMSNEDVELESD